MTKITVSYHLAPSIIYYTDKTEGEFRSPEVIQECLQHFSGLLVTQVSSFDNFPTCQTLELGDVIGVVGKEVCHDGNALELELNLNDGIDSVSEVKIAWECNIEKQSGEWEGLAYQEVQTNLKPKFVMIAT